MVVKRDRKNGLSSRSLSIPTCPVQIACEGRTLRGARVALNICNACEEKQLKKARKLPA